ncbi:MAG: hypothetical protein GW939_01590 [Candidatus Magasanikbacteria bacterium]|nr:hypothetical protein [Candidatus Magasanikbacteria bacterium]NCS72000.1 hypothetical protein [Candidatus Magasanikbacteria bacterium]
MTPYRRQTSLPPQPPHAQPVYFYKIIALTFLCLTIVLLGLVIFMSSKRAVITIETKMSPIDITRSVTVGAQDSAVVAVVSSTRVSLSETFAPTGSKEEPGVAIGVVTLHNDTALDQPLIATTRLLTTDNVLFRLKDRVTVPANGTVETAVYADVEGATGNVGSQKLFTIPGLTEAKQKVIYASSDSDMTGGVKTIGVLSQHDVDKAKTALAEKFLAKGKTAFAVAADDASAVFVVSDEEVTTDAEIGVEVDGFVVSGMATVAMVNYDEESLLSWAQDKLFSRAVDNSEIIQPQEGLPTVTLSSFDAQRGTAELSVVYGGQAALNPDSDKLDKSLFFGQTKDEVRRYLLTLDHVHGVDVKLSPAWIRSVPSVSDHVRVIVKKVQ